MAALRVFLPLAICLLLGHQTFAHNDAPCQKSEQNNAFDTFVKRHIRDRLPNIEDHNKWENYIKDNGGCDRPTQSFLQPEELQGVKDVCTDKGRKMYNKNLCISDKLFNFVTVTSEKVTCKINEVILEKKHLILGCDNVNNQCVPVHFEKNRNDEKPKNNEKSCQAL